MGILLQLLLRVSLLRLNRSRSPYSIHTNDLGDSAVYPNRPPDVDCWFDPEPKRPGCVFVVEDCPKSPPGLLPNNPVEVFELVLLFAPPNEKPVLDVWPAVLFAPKRPPDAAAVFPNEKPGLEAVELFWPNRPPEFEVFEVNPVELPELLPKSPVEPVEAGLLPPKSPPPAAGCEPVDALFWVPPNVNAGFCAVFDPNENPDPPELLPNIVNVLK
ncbi:hypothetical protein OGAPHI_002108 [Ogataea philodendri]|uniref:Uncharacterized protein n=1 Tax=Ogataea philodendri TaxID=1378263 RepID=A0A9P8PBS2_9ASCO|nr:uncharacterized protein OGAPHI_002108 [Ogataea philodendri]KAH3668354.1 hypothetical protein OGAPHI_002108 [Ogataea philodendri]